MGFFWEGKVFRKTFRILDLYEEKKTGRGTRFSWKFSGQCYMFFFFFLRFSPVLDWIELILAWFERYVYSVQVSGGQSWP